MKRRGFFQALATIAAAPIVPLDPVSDLWHRKISYKVEQPVEPELVDVAARIYRLNQPVVFIPGMRFEVDFVEV